MTLKSTANRTRLGTRWSSGAGTRELKSRPHGPNCVSWTSIVFQIAGNSTTTSADDGLMREGRREGGLILCTGADELIVGMDASRFSIPARFVVTSPVTT